MDADVPDWVSEARIAFFKICPGCGAERTICHLQYWEKDRTGRGKVEHWSCQVCGRYFPVEIVPE